MTSTKATLPAQLTAALHRAIVEVYTLRHKGPGVEKVSKIPIREDLTGDVQIMASSDAGNVELIYPSEEIHQSIIQSAREPAEPAERVEPVEENPGLTNDYIEEDVSEGTPVAEENMKTKESQPQEELPQSREETTLPENGEFEEQKLEAQVSSEQQEQLSQPQEETVLLEEGESEEQGLEAQISSWHPGWLEIPVTNLSIKFAVSACTNATSSHVTCTPPSQGHRLLSSADHLPNLTPSQ